MSSPLVGRQSSSRISLAWILLLGVSFCVVPSLVVDAYSFHPSTTRQSLAGKSPTIRSRSFSRHSSIITSTSRRQSASQLSMHMGHSHSHHHHHNHHERQDSVAATLPPANTFAGKFARLSRRPVVRLVFAALVVFVPVLLRRRHLPLAKIFHRSDVAAFCLVSAGLSFADSARRECKRVMDRVMNWKDGIVKHAPPTKTDSLVERLFSKKREQAADRVTLLGVITNLVLSVGKLIVGVTCHSSALIADAGHSLSDLFSDFITLWAVQIARLPPDDDHPYGHGKFEAVGALFLALTLLGTGLSVGAVSYQQMVQILKLQRVGGTAAAVAAGASVQVPTFPALIMAFLSIVSKEWLYRITRQVGEDLNSQVVLANAWHHRSDAYSSILALVSIALAMLVPGLLAADSAAGLLVGGMICMTGAEIMGEAVKQLTDASADESLVSNVKKLAIQESSDVLDVTRIRTRQMGSKAFVDVSIMTPDSLSNSATRAVEERVKYAILKNEPNIVDADVHAKASASSAGSSSTEDEATTSSNAASDQEMSITTMTAADVESHSHSHDHAFEEHADATASTSEATFERVTSSIDEEFAIAVPGANSLAEPVLAISSFQEVEDTARQLLDDHASIKSIEGCTVHYEEASQEVQVDVTVKLENPDWTTVTIANSLAKEFKGILEESDNIHKANIFLDLNGPAPSPNMDILPSSSGGADVMNGLIGNDTTVKSVSR